MASKVAAQGVAMLPADYWRSQHKLAFHLFLGTHRTSFSFAKVTALVIVIK